MSKCRGLESAMIIKVSIMAEAHPATSRKRRPLLTTQNRRLALLLSSELLSLPCPIPALLTMAALPCIPPL